MLFDGTRRYQPGVLRRILASDELQQSVQWDSAGRIYRAMDETSRQGSYTASKTLGHGSHPQLRADGLKLLLISAGGGFWRRCGSWSGLEECSKPQIRHGVTYH